MLSHIRKGTAWQPLARTLSGLLPQEQSQDDWQHLLQKASGGGGLAAGGWGRAELEQWGNECVYPAAGEEH